MEKSYLSVAQINTYIKNVFEAEFLLQNVSVFGEVSSYNISNGIAYFNIKDENNLLQCVLFGALKFDSPKIGDMVLVTGSVSYYAKGGRLSFNASKISPYGKGLLYEKFLELKNKLERQGYFDLSIKKPLPERVRKIGVVTSLTGAVVQDIIDVSTRRNNSVDIVIYPTKVQGVGAEFEIANAINFFSNYAEIDCVIVARGGGSIEDLQPFNTEIVADATFNCKKPLISAVGHETDFTIIDFVSDMRAPTPSAAAEIVVNLKSDDYKVIEQSVLRMEKILLNITQKQEHLVESNINRIYAKLEKTINNAFNFQNLLEVKLYENCDKVFVKAQNKLNILSVSLNNNNPKKLLSQGYTKIVSDGKVLKTIDGLSAGHLVSLKMIDGKLITEIKEVVKE